MKLPVFWLFLNHIKVVRENIVVAYVIKAYGAGVEKTYLGSEQTPGPRYMGFSGYF